MPYTYLLGWSKYKMYYYGVRYAKNADTSDLWIVYKTSSKYVKLYVEQYGEPDIIQVRKVHDSKENALLWEETVLRRMQVVERTDFLNRWDNNMVPLNLEGPFPFEDANIQNKVDKTLKSKYGVRGSGNDNIKKKVFETNVKRYGTHHTCMLDNVKEAREHACLTKFGTKNPFENTEKMSEVLLERYGVEYSIHLPHAKKRHKEAMENKDWSERDEKVKQTNLERYGVSCAMNKPGVRERHKRKCPHGCKNDHMYDAGNFVKHMKNRHNWSIIQIQEYKLEN